MNKQEVYNRVKDHLLKQNKKSQDANGCVYRGPDNTKCAIGCLIDDWALEKYGLIGFRNNLEVGSYYVLDALIDSGIEISRSADPDCIFSFEDVNFLRELQKVHDTYLPFEWKDRLNDFAKIHNLTP